MKYVVRNFLPISKSNPGTAGVLPLFLTANKCNDKGRGNSPRGINRKGWRGPVQPPVKELKDARIRSGLHVGGSSFKIDRAFV